MTLRVSVRMLAKTSHRAFVSHLFKKLELSHQAFGSFDPVYFQRVGSSQTELLCEHLSVMAFARLSAAAREWRHHHGAARGLASDVK
jgi:hypothetical protein